jgi:hypothetical protein
LSFLPLDLTPAQKAKLWMAKSTATPLVQASTALCFTAGSERNSLARVRVHDRSRYSTLFQDTAI